LPTAVRRRRQHAAASRRVRSARRPRTLYPRPNVGTFPIRFPSEGDPGDAGWHVDGSDKVEPGPYKVGDPLHVIHALPATVHARPLAWATGNAGDVYLCHPFLVHAASWPHRGKAPRFIAQPPLTAVGLLELERADGAYSPVELAVRLGLGR
jgi:hypothetical protein